MVHSCPAWDSGTPLGRPVDPEVYSSIAVSSADGRTAVSGMDDQTVRVWDLGSRQCLATLTGHTGGVESVAVSADGPAVLVHNTSFGIITGIATLIGAVGGFFIGGLTGKDGWDWSRAWAGAGSGALVGLGVRNLHDDPEAVYETLRCLVKTAVA